MRYLKYTDATLQLSFTILTALSLLNTRFTWTAVATLLIVQLASITIHRALEGRLYPSRHRTVFITLVFFLAITSPFWLWFGYSFLLAWLPLSVWYSYICYTEASIIAHKQLVHLK